MLVQQQKKYHKMTMDEIVNFFQICHSTDQLLHEQRQREAAAARRLTTIGEQRL